MKDIIAIVGLSGSGKDTCADYLVKSKGWNKIVSYTTRPRRTDEGDDSHIFVEQFDRMERPFAYCEYGGYQYWTMWNQFRDDMPNVYVIDETSLIKLYYLRDSINKLYEDITPRTYKTVADMINEQRFRLTSVLVVRDNPTVDSSRTIRDSDRQIKTDKIQWDYIVDNNGSLDELYEKLEKIKT